MLWIIVVILVVLWLLGLVAHVGGGLIHALLVIAFNRNGREPVAGSPRTRIGTSGAANRWNAANRQHICMSTL